MNGVTVTAERDLDLTAKSWVAEAEVRVVDQAFYAEGKAATVGQKEEYVARALESVETYVHA